MTTDLQSSFDLLVEPNPHDATFVLVELEVFNWGPFEGMHRAVIDPAGTAIIGPTGSGKTTLIDALMTLLVQQPKYNLASTGGHESDRTTISYVRGVLGGDGATDGEKIARPGKSLTGLCATYRSGGETLKLAALLWTDGTSNAATDLKRRWIFSQAEDESLADWLRLQHEDGVRGLMGHGRETGRLRIFESKKAYLAHARKFFDVGDNAFTLLNRAAGLKQLNSINEIFRDLVLDDRAAFDRALEVAQEFDNLAEIHAELETARRQQESLEPIAKDHAKLEKARNSAADWIALKRILPIWFAILGERLWAGALADLTRQQEEKSDQIAERQRAEASTNSHVDTLRERYLQLGGNVIGELENTISEKKKVVEQRRKSAEQYLSFADQFDLDQALTPDSFRRNQELLEEKKEQIAKARESKQEEALEALSQKRDHQLHLDEARENLRRVEERPGSNLPPKFHDFRSALAERLRLAEDDLPYLAELVEVRAEESDWRGAIERAIGPERLRVLVPEDRFVEALRWVNHRDNRLHVRLQKARSHARSPEFFQDGFTRKLNFKPHPLREAAKDLLAGRDRHCVTSVEALQQIEHGMTIEGTMSGRHGKFEKQDQRRLDEGWMTGFDNRDQLAALRGQIATLTTHTDDWSATATLHQKALTTFDQQLQLIKTVSELDFSTIDLPAAEADLENSESRLRAMLDPHSDASRAKADFDEAKREFDAIRSEIQTLTSELAVTESRRADAENARQTAEDSIGSGLDESETTLASENFPASEDHDPKQLGKLETTERDRIDTALETVQEKIRKFEQTLIRQMEKAKAVDTGALVESDTVLTDIPDYLERLRILVEEALPDKLGRFLDYLNRSSDQGVTQLLAGIDQEVDGIETRICELNVTLAKVDFRDARYLQLQPQRIKHERLRSLETAQRKLRSAALQDDNGESHYRALRSVIEILREAGENQRQLGSRALLDPRHRLDFYVVEVDRASGAASAPRSGSQSGSGGEKELMASHILTASLSYALCPTETSRPLYGTVVLDEAFSKSSPSAAGRIIEALRIFGLHPIFVTPNKEIGLLRKHTRRVICVQRPGKAASLASISWEELEDLRHPSG